MNRYITALVLVTIVVVCPCHSDTSASDVAFDIYKTCLSQFSTSCVKPKALAWMSQAVKQDVIQITDDLSIVKTGDDEPVDFEQQRSGGVADAKIELFDKIDSFLATHSLKMDVPSFLKSKVARSLVPKSFLQGGLGEGLQVPLSEGNAVEGRGFVKKVMIPFLLGLKFKTTVLVPLALALIALKTWKAMTLGLLSLVLSGALVIFKFAKPKVVNYEVVHYPHPPHHHHHVEHHVDHPPQHGWEPPHGWSRQFDAQQMAYGGQI